MKLKKIGEDKILEVISVYTFSDKVVIGNSLATKLVVLFTVIDGDSILTMNGTEIELVDDNIPESWILKYGGNQYYNFIGHTILGEKVFVVEYLNKVFEGDKSAEQKYLKSINI